jgi:hypothetical protein
MPFCEIPLDSLDHITLFGYQILNENEEFLDVRGHCGRRQIILKTKPVLWFEPEDMGDAMQLKAVAVFTE